MYEDPSTWFPKLDKRSGVYVADGYGLKIRVDRGHLVVEDGAGPHRRVERFTRAMAGIDRLVLLGHTGFITLEALRWMHDANIALIHIDIDGQLITTSARYNVDEPSLRRAQALAMDSPTGVDITRDLLRRKLGGQRDLLVRLGLTNTAIKEVEAALVALDSAQTLERLRFIESRGAAAYWSAGETADFPIAPKDQGRVPAHWLSFGPRTSPLTGQKSFAVTPANAMRNYLYALAEGEGRLACMRVGLDPGIGVLHADKNGRDSLALDLLEIVRPQIDEWVAALVSSRVFSRSDFKETREGAVRVLPPLTHVLAATCGTWARTLIPVAEHVAGLLRSPGSPRRRRSTKGRLTSETIKEPRLRALRQRQPRVQSATAQACKSCGVIITGNGARLCDDCRRAVEQQQMELARSVRMKMRAQGKDPAVSEAARVKRMQKMKGHAEDLRRWKGPQSDPEVFKREILPGLADVRVATIAKSTGLSPVYCSMIRSGRYVPHPRHWDRLRNLGTDSAPLDE